MRRRHFVGAIAALATTPTRAQQEMLPLLAFLRLLGGDAAAAGEVIPGLRNPWRDAYAAPLIEIVQFSPFRVVREAVAQVLREATGVAGDGGVDAWYRWLWNREVVAHPQYAEFKARLYELIDPSLGEYFRGDPRSLIRLDEVRWGGVIRDGIPPLDRPAMLAAREARWLADSHVVFGVEIDGEARAYPKRILAWHEMVRDRVGGREINGVYCTLCGAMIVYDPRVAGVHHALGTSGFLYRSNKLMYDQATKSLWNTIDGVPVIGRLAGQGIRLAPLTVVTTTWGEWRRRHPTTRVLSPATGHRRDYSEGAAYRDYFGTDALMFAVPRQDDRLYNKAEVFVVRPDEADDDVLAMSADFLARHPVYHDRVGRAAFVVLTSPGGANRAYAAPGVRFASWDGQARALDSAGRAWRVTENGMTGPDGSLLRRLPAHRAFWFGWVAQHPRTRLVK
ncbi:MAG: DUF3179 domain-containing protein [Burkholderiales bacterium]